MFEILLKNIDSYKEHPFSVADVLYLVNTSQDYETYLYDFYILDLKTNELKNHSSITTITNDQTEFLQLRFK